MSDHQPSIYDKAVKYGKKEELGLNSSLTQAMREGRSATAAADTAGISRATAYAWKAGDAEFAAAWDDAAQQMCDRCEDEAYRRAVQGFNVRKDALGNTILDYSDGLLTTLLKAKRPEQYNPHINATIAHNNTTNLNVKITTQEAIEQLERLGLPMPVLETDYAENSKKEG